MKIHTRALVAISLISFLATGCTAEQRANLFSGPGEAEVTEAEAEKPTADALELTKPEDVAKKVELEVETDASIVPWGEMDTPVRRELGDIERPFDIYFVELEYQDGGKTKQSLFTMGPVQPAFRAHNEALGDPTKAILPEEGKTHYVISDKGDPNFGKAISSHCVTYALAKENRKAGDTRRLVMPEGTVCPKIAVCEGLDRNSCKVALSTVTEEITIKVKKDEGTDAADEATEESTDETAAPNSARDLIVAVHDMMGKWLKANPEKKSDS